ncbi:MAG: S8 family serine peptidase [Vicinamibacterales bacterium]
MRERFVNARVRVMLLAGVVAASALIAAPRVRGQNASAPVSPMSSDRAQQFIDAAARGLGYLPGEAIVKFAPGTTVAARTRTLQALRDRPGASALRWIGDSTAVVRDPGESDARVVAQQLMSQPEVLYAVPNYVRHTFLTPNDPGYAMRQWNFQAIDMPHAWDINPGGNASMIVAILDTGVTTFTGSMTFATWNGTAIQNISVPFTPNTDLSASRLVSPMDFATNMGTTVLDTDGHGTHVSSTAGEDTNNGTADAGIAYASRIMPVKVCVSYWDVQFSYSAGGGRGFVPFDAGGCDDSAIISGIHYAANNGAKVINISLGGGDADPALLDAINFAVGKGVFISMAAGNDFQNGNPIEYPAAYALNVNGAMSVGATNRDGVRAYYSSTGSFVEIAAPGGDDQDSDASGNGFIFQSTYDFNVNDPGTVIFPRFDQYAEVGYEGTSMATPHVAGLAALLMTQGITKPSAVEDLIKRTAKLIGSPSSTGGSRNDDVGYGLIQPRAALFGFGVKQ